MIKKVLLLITILSLLSLTACSDVSNLSLSNLLGGSGSKVSAGEGIKLEIIEYPKGELFDAEPFSLKTRITNYNTEPVEGLLCVHDTPPDRMGGIPSSSCKDIYVAASITGSGGDVSPSVEEFQFPTDQGAYAYQNIPKDITTTSIIFSSLTYSVKQKAIAGICIRNPSISAEKIKEKLGVSCDDSTSPSIQQPKLPLIVSKIEKDQTSAGPNNVNVRLRIYVKQDEEGQIIASSQVLEENPSLKQTVAFSVELASGTKFNCNPAKTLEFNQYEKVINCFASININQEAITDTIIVNLDYGFRMTTKLSPIDLKSTQNYIVS